MPPGNHWPKAPKCGVEDLVPGFGPGNALGLVRPVGLRVAHPVAIGLRHRSRRWSCCVLPLIVAAVCRAGSAWRSSDGKRTCAEHPDGSVRPGDREANDADKWSGGGGDGRRFRVGRGDGGASGGAGRKVAVADINQAAAEATAATIGGIGIGCDVADAASAEAAFATARRRTAQCESW